METHPENGIPGAEAGAILSINLGALTANWRFMREKAATAECAAVVKADAYGTGIEHTVPALAAAGCKTFFVAHLSEAKRVRAVATDAVIYVLNGLLPETCDAYLEYALRPVLASPEQVTEWTDFCGAHGLKLPAAVQVDTGMARLGLSITEAQTLSRETLRFELSLLMSHFVASEEPENPLNQQQIDLFETARTLFPGVPASLANSSGILLPQAPHYDLVRPGYALYGGNPCPGHPNPMREVVRLNAHILQVRTIPRGTSVGYNGRWTAERDSRLATLSIGYADGFPRSASGTREKYAHGKPAGVAEIGGILCPFVGTVSMDLIIIDITDTDPKLTPPDWRLATLIGGQLDIDTVAHNVGTIGYEILTGLGRRYARVYFSEVH